MRPSTLAAAAVAAVAVLALVLTSSSATAQMGPDGPPSPSALAQATVTQNLYVPIAPCRVVDTRVAGGHFTNGQARTFYVAGTTGFAPQGGKSGGCGIPVGAVAATMSITAVNPSGSGYIRAWAAGASEPTATLVNYATTSTTAGGTVPLAAGSGKHLAVKNAAGPTDVVVDVTGYYAPQIYGTFTDTGSLYTGNGTLAGYAHGSAGNYTLRANRDLTGCTVTTSSYYYAYNVSAYVSGEFLYVQMTDQNGTGSNYYFQVHVAC